MSNRMMSVAEARKFATGYGATMVNQARRTIVAQAEQIERLQAALHKADKWGDILGNLYEDEYLHPEDMEAPK